MAKKKDPSITFLNWFGYNVVKLPRVGIEPMDVIGKDQATPWLGPLETVWNSQVPVPQPGEPHAAMTSILCAGVPLANMAFKEFLTLKLDACWTLTKIITLRTAGFTNLNPANSFVKEQEWVTHIRI